MSVQILNMETIDDGWPFFAISDRGIMIQLIRQGLDFPPQQSSLLKKFKVCFIDFLNM
uniref:Uncharacterized protein n=1 Tax=Triticum urartu TaxID=4572 RepID=A0A8R7P9C2_TRIUA